MVLRAGVCFAGAPPDLVLWRSAGSPIESSWSQTLNKDVPSWGLLQHLGAGAHIGNNNETHCTFQDISWLEFFAGTANLTACMVSAQYKSAKFDVMYNKQPAGRRSNFMDLTHPAGWAFLNL